MADIVLTTVNAKYIHAAFGLRYLRANLGELRERTALREFDIQQRPLDIVEQLLAETPRVVGFGVYIWNTTITGEVVTLLKRIAPQVVVVLGGPEVSYETEDQEVVRRADYVITGEADLAFAILARQLLEGARPNSRIIAAPLPDLGQLVLPYDEYTDEDVAHRIVYVEASRGCPFECEFCLSSLDIPVRRFPLGSLLAAFERLATRGVRHFKFVDRTFNLNLRVGRAILEFFLERWQPGWFLHLELIPDRLPSELRELIRCFPPGSLQFEVGIQTLNETVAANIRRRQDLARTEENLRFLRDETGVHLHADLIVGLPGESLESFGAGFDRLVQWRPQEIQVGILKRLRGTSLDRHRESEQMVFSPLPPYEILRNGLIDFANMQRLRRFARYWDLVGNSGNFVESTPLLWRDGRSPFSAFLAWSDWLAARIGRQHGIALLRLAEFFHEYLTKELGLEVEIVRAALARDYRRGGHRDVPAWLEPDGSPRRSRLRPAAPASGAVRSTRRQARHRPSPAFLKKSGG